MKRILLSGCMLLALGACSINPTALTNAFKSERVVGETLTELARSDALTDALLIWNAIGPEGWTIELEDSLIAAVNTTVGVVGAVSPITATIYVDRVEQACAELVDLDQAVKDAAGCKA